MEGLRREGYLNSYVAQLAVDTYASLVELQWIDGGELTIALCEEVCRDWIGFRRV